MYANFYNWLGQCLFSIRVGSEKHAQNVAVLVFQEDYTTIVDWNITKFPCGTIVV